MAWALWVGGNFRPERLVLINIQDDIANGRERRGAGPRDQLPDQGQDRRYHAYDNYQEGPFDKGIIIVAHLIVGAGVEKQGPQYQVH